MARANRAWAWYGIGANYRVQFSVSRSRRSRGELRWLMLGPRPADGGPCPTIGAGSVGQVEAERIAHWWPRVDFGLASVEQLSRIDEYAWQLFGA